MTSTHYRLLPFLPLLPLLPVVFACLAGDCVFAGDPSETHQRSSYSSGSTPHPPGLPSIWKGRNVSELVAAMGEPDMILETTVRGIVIYGDTHSVMYVYHSGNRSYEAYVVEHNSGKILAYQRR